MNAPETSDPRAKRRRRLRGYVGCWLLSSFIVLATSATYYVGKAAEGATTEMRFGAVILFSFVISLLSLPSLWLLRLFPEPSENTWLRFFRRVLIGLPCGAMPAALLAGFVASHDAVEAKNATVYLIYGPLFGLAAAIIDSIRLDRVHTFLRDADERDTPA